MDETLPVCSDAKQGVTQRCQMDGCDDAAKKRFCSNACRQAWYRTKSEARKALLKRDKEWRRRRHNEWTKARLYYKALTPLGSYSGQDKEGVGTLKTFWIKNGERLHLDEVSEVRS